MLGISLANNRYHVCLCDRERTGRRAPFDVKYHRAGCRDAKQCTLYRPNTYITGYCGCGGARMREESLVTLNIYQRNIGGCGKREGYRYDLHVGYEMGRVRHYIGDPSGTELVAARPLRTAWDVMNRSGCRIGVPPSHAMELMC